MIIENVDVYNLIPTQIISLIEKLNQALEYVKMKKDTISKTANYEKKNIKCPYCSTLHIVKNGHTKLGVQTYKCKECNKRFNDLTSTIFAKSHLSYEQIEIFLTCLNDKIPLRKIAERMGVNKNTAYLLRLKYITTLKEIRENIKLTGEIEADEIYKSINLKGTRKGKMPRASKPRTSKGNTTRGISSHKVCIESAIDENDNMFLEIVGTGPVTSDMVKKSLGIKLGKVRKLITDCKSSYEEMAKENHLNIKQVKSGCYTDNEGNSLANINSLHSGLTTFLSRFRGVSTKHLQAYLDWYIFEKYLNYTFNQKQQINQLLNNAFINYSDLSSKTMYDNSSGIDFSLVYADYHFVPSRTI